MAKTKKGGFTLVEVLTVMAIAGILASIVLVNMNSARTRSRDNAVFTQISSTQGMAFKCLINGVSGVSLNTPSVSGDDICSVEGYSVWPVLTVNSGWAYGSGFGWCNVDSGNSCSPYADGTCGGRRSNGSFCYMFTNSDDVNKKITCTQSGCVKSGF